MNGKIKTKFAALFAVALMITVCVVPMVGNDYGEAETVIPSNSEKFVVSGTIFDEAGNAITYPVQVKLTINSTTPITTITSSGSYSFDVYYTSAVTLKVEVDTSSNEIKVNGEDVVNAAKGKSIGSLNFTNVTSDINNANLQFGTYVISGKVYYKTGQIYDQTGMSVILYEKSNKQSVNDKAYQKNSAEITATVTDGEFRMLVPVDTENSADFKGFYLYSVQDSTYVFKSNEISLGNLTDVSVNAEKLSQGVITMQDFGGKELIKNLVISIGSNNTSELTILNPSTSFDDEYKAYYQYVEVTSQTGKNVKVVDSSKNYGGADGQLFDSVGGTYNINAIYGKTTVFGKAVILSDIKIGTTNAVIADDEYIIPTNGLTGDVKIMIGSYEAATLSVTSGPISCNISADTTGLALVTGNISGSYPVSSATIAYDSAANVTYKSGATDAAGNYWFVAKIGSIIKVTPTLNDHTFDAATKQIEIIKGKTLSLNFTAESDKITFKVLGPDGKGLEGVTVYYSIDCKKDKDNKYVSGEFKNAITDKNGVAKVTVNKGMVNTGFYTYYEKSGYTFTQKDRDSSKLYVEADAKTLEEEKSFTLKIESNAITDAVASTLGVKVFECDKEIINAVSIYDNETELNSVKYAGNGVYKFIGYAGECYIVKIDSSESKYEFPSVTEWSNDLSILSLFGTTAGTVMDADNKYGIAGIELEFYSNDKMVYETVTSLNGSFSVVLKSGSYDVKVTDPNGVYTFGDDGQTQVSVSTGSILIKANEQKYTDGKVIDGNNKPIINSDITVKAVDVDGNVVGSIAEVDAYGNYVIITDYKKAVKLITTDADGKYTFDDVYRSGTSAAPTFNLTIPANEAVYTVTVKDKANDPIVGADVEILLGNAVDGFQTVVSDVVTDKDGKVEAFLVKPEAGDKYQAKVPSFGMGLSIDAVDFSDVNADLKSDVYLRTVTIKSAAKVVIEEAGYIMTVFNNITGDEVGKVTTDSKGVMKFYSANDALTVSIQSPEGSKYTFKDNVVLSLTDVVTSTGTSILAKQTLYSGLVKTLNEVNLEGVKVTLFNNEKEIVGEGITDADGKYEVVAIGATDAVAADAELDIGKFTFDEDGVAFKDTGSVSDGDYVANIAAEQFLYSGYYANGAVVKDVKVSYTDSTGAEALATVVDNKYYIASVDAISGNVTATATNFYASGPLDGNLKVDAQKVPVYNIANSQNSDYVQIYAPSKIVYGTVITLAAQNEYSTGVPGEDGVIQKYKFAGWYVNGDKVSDELIYAYTVEGDCTIYADYKVSSYVAAPADESNGLSMDVLVLGIVIVVLGLLAFAYAVKFKKE